MVEGFGNAIGIKTQSVPGSQLALLGDAVEILEKSQHAAGGREPLDGIVAAEDQSGEVPAIRITDAALCLVVLDKQERRVGFVRGGLEEQAVEGLKESRRLLHRDGHKGTVG